MNSARPETQARRACRTVHACSLALLLAAGLQGCQRAGDSAATVNPETEGEAK